MSFLKQVINSFWFGMLVGIRVRFSIQIIGHNRYAVALFLYVFLIKTKTYLMILAQKLILCWLSAFLSYPLQLSRKNCRKVSSQSAQ